MSRYTSVAPFLSLDTVWFAIASGYAMHYEHAGHGASQLSLNNGNKWTESVRPGIPAGVRVVDANGAEVFAGGLPAPVMGAS